MAKKQSCPYCGNKFVYLSRHKCKFAPEDNESESTTTNSGNTEPSDDPIYKTKSTAQKKNQKKINQTSSKNSHSSSESTTNKKQQNMQKKKSYSEIDRDILSLIETRKIMHRDELSDLFELDEKTIEKSLGRLEGKQKISMHSDVVEGVRKDKITYVEEYKIKDRSEIIDKNDPVAWETLGDCPCFLCPDITKCNTGQIETNPIKCMHLVEWLNCQLIETVYKNPFKGSSIENA